MDSLDTGVYIEQAALERYAVNMAKCIGGDGEVSARRAVRETERCLRRIGAAADRAAVRETERGQQAAEWLLDNWHIALREGKAAAGRLRRAGRMPKAASGRRLRMSETAAALVRAGRGRVTAERTERFLAAYQTQQPLTERELGFFTEVLKTELVRYLAALSDALRGPDRQDGELAALMENVFTSLRFLSAADLSETLERVNPLERIYSRDPAKIYPLMDAETRAAYRRETALLAEKHGKSEREIAEKVLELAETKPEKHVGWYLFRRPLGRGKRSTRGGLYIGGVVLTSLFLAVLTGVLLGAPGIAALLLFPISEVVKNSVDCLAVRLVRPRPLPRLELKGGVPRAGSTLCVISALLAGERDGEKYAGLLEEYRLANRDAGPYLQFGVLADLPEAASEEMPGDADRIRNAEQAVEALNRKYGGGFYLLLRPRMYSETDGRWLGWERKRGAITELVRLLSGADSGVRCAAGEREKLEGIRFLITLDADTRLCVGAARELIGAALHPLNMPVIDRRRRIVTAGSGILQPRVSVELEAAGRSDFTRIFAGQGGVDPYGGTASDVYQDLFGAGSYTGKGVINVPAFFACLDGRFPTDRILSHDLLEGAYLRCAYAGDTEVTDGFPGKVLSYYARMHRWVRGDWQISPWLCGRVPTGDGGRERNPLGELDRWKIFDNLRRSLVPVFTFAAVLASMFFSGRAMVWAGALAALSVLSNLLLSSAALALRRDPGSEARYHSTIIAGFAGWLLQTLVRLMLLPYEAWICASAILTALYRMLISHKRLLAWVTAADAERRPDGLRETMRRMWPCLAAGAAAVLLARHTPAIAVGVIWLFAPLYALSLSREIPAEEPVSGPNRLLLQAAAGDIWRYFEDFITEADGWLPPDNWQEQPAAGLAHRTSPTNIGLALLAALAAADLGLTPRQKAMRLIEHMLTAAEKLPKWQGHLYNWYDTRSGLPLQPAYVSTVDSGNLAGCLITLREGLLEQGETALAARADALCGGMSFAPLYDAERKLFFIGWNAADGTPTEGWYDLLASEARQTSYIAAARGDVPPRHWRRLSRALVSLDKYCGMVSWTGTMFEYLMPNLIMPCYKNSLLYESMRFCVYAQKRAAKELPWGMSESAFYAFDPALNYQYKAHGAQTLALKREMDRDRVIAPYASFLALTTDRKSAIRNLRRLRDMGLEGRYGFYEAVDFTRDRVPTPEGTPVRTFMVHHLAMSLLAAHSVLCDTTMQKRFLRDREMAAYRELLQEKVPVGAVVLRQTPRETPEKPQRVQDLVWTSESDCGDVLTPRCCLLSNGLYSVLLTDTGMTRSVWGDKAVTRFEPRQLSEKNGMQFRLALNGETFSLTPSPDFAGNAVYKAEFSGRAGTVAARRGDVLTAVRVHVPETDAGEVRTVSVRNAGAAETEGTLLCAFEPVLQPAADYEAHPAFAKLSLAVAAEEDRVFVFRRGGGRAEPCVLCAASDCPAVFTAEDGGDSLRPGGAPQAAPECRITISVPLRLKPGESREIRFAFAPARDAEDARAAASRLLRSEPEQGPALPDRLAQKLGLSPAELDQTYAMLTELLFVTPARRQRRQYIEAGHGGRQGLWPFGISGDLPIAAAAVRDEETLQTALGLLSRQALLTRCGVRFDLVLLTADGSDYRQPLRRTILDAMREQGLERVLGRPGGVHLLAGDAPGAENVLVLAAYLEGGHGALRREPQRRVTAERASTRADRRGVPATRYLEDGAFVFELENGLPPAAWSHVLTNGRYGWLATECGTGNMWMENAREKRVNPWLNDTQTVRGPETLTLRQGSASVSLFADADGLPCRVTYGFGYACWEKRIGAASVKITGFVPPDADARVLLIELENVAADAVVAWCTELTLGSDDFAPETIETAWDGVFTARRTGGAEPFVFRAAASVLPTAWTGDLLAWRTGRTDGAVGTGLLPCAGLLYPVKRRMILAAGCADRETLEALTDWETACSALEAAKARWQTLVRPHTIRTPSAELDAYLNGWSLYQTLACRLLARTSMSQSGGAYGFRDQLQDVCALLDTEPARAAEQLRRAAAHQYEEGDVQHWWHPAGRAGERDKGVRTRCSDDLLWLAYVLCRYTEATGDLRLCRETAPYLRSPVLGPEERERYEEPETGPETDTLLGHAMRALDLALARGTGAHGLAKMGGGDWNDGMNLVGAEGRGESVWLTWFAALTAERMGALCAACGMTDAGDRYRYASLCLRRAADAAWDGKWYLRGWYDDGAPLGTDGDAACRIDSIAQSFAAFGGGSPTRVRTALRSASDLLFDRENRLIRLFTPPFDGGPARPGYIAAYCPGLRENGGQYTHGAVWLALAMFRQGMAGEGWEMLRALLPSDRDPQVYRREPYVLAADVSTAPGCVGRGGWPWYTGAAGWFHQTAVRELLGLRVRGGRLFVEPHLPPSWPGYEAIWPGADGPLHISVRQKDGLEIRVNDAPCDPAGYALPIRGEAVFKPQIV